MPDKWHKLLMTRAASQRMMKMGAALWGSQSWLQPAFSRPCAGHEGSLMAQEPPERRLRARLPAPRLFSRKAPPCASERSSELEFGHFQATAPHWWGMLQRDLRRGRIEQKCAPKPPPIRPHKPLQTNGGTDELAKASEARPSERSPEPISRGSACRCIRKPPKLPLPQ
jgi:hypothetical protein